MSHILALHFLVPVANLFWLRSRPKVESQAVRKSPSRRHRRSELFPTPAGPTMRSSTRAAGVDADADAAPTLGPAAGLSVSKYVSSSKSCRLEGSALKSSIAFRRATLGMRVFSTKLAPVVGDVSFLSSHSSMALLQGGGGAWGLQCELFSSEARVGSRLPFVSVAIKSTDGVDHKLLGYLRTPNDRAEHYQKPLDRRNVHSSYRAHEAVHFFEILPHFFSATHHAPFGKIFTKNMILLRSLRLPTDPLKTDLEEHFLDLLACDSGIGVGPANGEEDPLLAHEEILNPSAFRMVWFGLSAS